jgi:hypothetical protein
MTHFRPQLTQLEEQVGVMKTDIRRQDEVTNDTRPSIPLQIIEARLKSNQQSKEDATNILGDKVMLSDLWLTILCTLHSSVSPVPKPPNRPSPAAPEDGQHRLHPGEDEAADGQSPGQPCGAVQCSAVQ